MAKQRFAHVWIGVFEDNAPEDYFVEQYDEDDAPLNQFAAEQNEDYYDHDWIEISYLDLAESEDVRSFVDGHSYCEHYIDDVCIRAESAGLETINVFVLCVQQDEFDNPKTASGDGYRLEYLGMFPYRH